MLSDLIAKIEKERQSYNLEMQPPCTLESIEELSYLCLKKLSYKIPNAYFDFIQITDGIFYNGIQIYASKTSPSLSNITVVIEGLIEANELWREDENKNRYFFFAESGDALYGHNLKNNRFEYMDRITLEAINNTTDANQFIELCLNHILGNYDFNFDNNNSSNSWLPPNWNEIFGN